MSLLSFSRMAPRVAKSSAATATARVAVASRHLSTTAPAMTDSVLYENVGTTRIYKLNRPKALNALDQDMIDSLVKEAKTWRNSELCRLIIGRGDERAFCAGGDVKTLVESRPEHGSKLALKFFKDEFELNWEMGRFGKPYVAVIDGFTMGGGAGISLPAGVRIATKKTVFAMPETKIGYAPDVGGNYYIAQLDGNIGAWLAITGQETWGRAVYELGIATHYVEPEVLPDLVQQLQELENPTLESVSRLVNAYHVPAQPAGTPLSSKASREGPSPITGEIRVLLDKAFGLDSLQAIYAELQAAEKDSSLADTTRAWATAQREMLDNRSPTGMAVALANFKLARAAKRLNTVLENDIRMATGFVGNDRPTEDFTIGVTHVLINKDKNKPHRADWVPSSINDAFVEPASIRKNFLDPKNAKLQAEVPTLDFDPVPTTKEGPDSTWGNFRKYGLPSEAEIRGWIRGETSGSGAFKLREDELVSRVLEARGDTASPREAEIRERVQDVVVRNATKDKDGFLDWN